MDECTLNDLLECSVCLERLDTSSKVLPCQHTFCKKCLEEIVDRHKELKCPECRVLVPIKIDELPPNVLLMRILEGIRNAAPKKQHLTIQSNNITTSIQHNTPSHTIAPGTPDRHVSNKNQAHIVLPYAKALYDYSAKQVGDLSFKKGDIIYLRKRVDNHWYQGECDGKHGVFPLSYVQIITPVPSHIPQCKALYDFDEEGCLAFKKGDIISVIRRVDENWAEGKLQGKIGIFPLTFVELNSLARSLMKLSTNTQPGPSRLAPPTPTSDDSIPLIPTDHSRNIANITNHHRHSGHGTHLIHTNPIPNSDSSSTVSSGSSSTTTTPNTSSSNTSSTPSTAPSSPASPPPRNQAVPPRTQITEAGTVNTTPQRINNPPPPRPDSHTSSSSHHHHHNREKRHSFTSLTPPQRHSNTHRHSAEILSPDSEIQTQKSPQITERDRSRKNNELANTLQLPAAYIALYPYKPQKSDELELRKGGIYMVTERCQDGWFKGTSNRTQKCGVFPGNYVTLARGAPKSPQSSRTHEASGDQKISASYTRNGKSSLSSKQNVAALPPELPPRSGSPANSTNTISSSWHGQQDNAAAPLGRSSSAIMSGINTQLNVTTVAKPVEKSKDRKEKGTVSLMRRLTSIKRSKSPPASSYSMDNPVFEDSTTTIPITTAHPVHVRSGSCPSQLLQVQPTDHHRMFASTSQRLKHKERPSVLTHNNARTENHHHQVGSSGSSPDIHHHRKSNSLDAGSRTKTKTQTVHERFRCIAPYPPNSEYELELQVNDIIYVHKKREDGWYKGVQQRTGRTGLFPASFVETF